VREEPPLCAAVRLSVQVSDSAQKGLFCGPAFGRRRDQGAGELWREHGDGPRGQVRGRGALRGLDFFVQADLFMTPTAELADIVLPVATPFESEALKIGFDGVAR
jgi:hypothetical protein